MCSLEETDSIMKELSFSVSERTSCNPIWEFPKITGTFLGGPHNKDYTILGSILGGNRNILVPWELQCAG